MTKQFDELPPNIALGTWLGRRQAFAVIASECAAAEAEAIRHIRQARLYKSVTPHWSEFCVQHLGMSKSNADRLIRLFDEFGPAYFHARQLTGISPAEYRAVAPIANLPPPSDDPQLIPTSSHV